MLNRSGGEHKLMKKLLVLFLLLFTLPCFAAGPEIFLAAKGSNPPTTPVISATAGDAQVTIALVSGDVGSLINVLYWDTTAGNTHANNISSATLVAAGFPGTPYVHTGRTNGTPYYYSLVGTDLAGSTESNEATATPAAAGGYYYPNNISSFTSHSGSISGGVYIADTISPGASVTITKIGMYIYQKGASANECSVGIYTNASTAVKLAGCYFTPNDGVWGECTISYAISSGTTYTIWGSCNHDAWLVQNSASTCTPYYNVGTYTQGMPSSLAREADSAACSGMRIGY